MTEYWIWAQKIIGYGNTAAGQIITDGISPRDFFEHFYSYSFINDAMIKRSKRFYLNSAKKVVEFCDKNGIKILTPDSKLYPFSLRNICNPPLVLYYKGTFPNFNTTPSVCIVGPRKVSDYGYKCSYSMSARLSLAGILTVSGGAVGSDYAAHDGALVHGCPTVAFLANGFGNDYLKTNLKLRKRIEENGCLITEFLPGTAVEKQNFHIRNRLMSGITDCTVVIEAKIKSGALITANTAVEQNKEVYVIEGEPYDINYEGSNALIRDGAKKIIDLSDVFGEYLVKYAEKIDIKRAYEVTLKKPVYPENNDEDKKKKVVLSQKDDTLPNVEEKETEINKKILPQHLSNSAKVLYNYLDKHNFCCDDIPIGVMEMSEIPSAIGELEIFGLIKALPGGRYEIV